MRKSYINKCVQHSTLVHFASFSAYQEHLRMGLKISKEKVSIIQFGISTIFFDTIDSVSAYSYLESINLTNKKYILFTGNIYKHKNISTLLKAFSIFSKNFQYDDFYLVIAGKVMEKDAFTDLDNLTNSLDLKNKVIFLGEVDYGKLPALYQSAKLFVFPSALETFGFPMIEAMACRVPLIAADTPIAREICGDASLYFPLLDQEQLASLMLRVIEDDDLRQALIRKGVKKARTFTWEEMAKNMLNLFSDAILVK